MDEASEARRVALAAGEECLAAALDYLRRGWPALGLCPPDHYGVGRSHGRSCDHPGKRPWPDGGEWKRWQDKLPSEEIVRRWWARHPMLNVGVAMGPLSGLVGIDPDGPGGEARLSELSGGDLPPTLEFCTSNGRRLLYRMPAGANFRPTYQAVATKEELRFLGYGSQTVMPPSRHVSGIRYAWKPGCSPDEIKAAPAPEWLVRYMTAPPPSKSPAGPDDGELITEGRRDGTLTSWAGTMRGRGFSPEAIQAALAVENLARCDPPLDEAQVAKIARSVGRYEAGTPDILFTRTTIDVGDSLGMHAMTEVETKPLRWLVPGYLPLGKLTLLAGEGGHGKSMITLHVAAMLSVGKLPFGLSYERREPASTLMVSCEDDEADTVLPRLMAAGADLSRIFQVEGVKDKDGKLTPFSLLHYEAMGKELNRRPDVRLVIVDPAGAFVGRTGVDDHKDSDLRALLGPLAVMAAERDVTIILVKHLNKAITAKAIHRVGGSVGYVNTVRAAVLVAPDPDDETRRRKLLMPVKANLGPPASPLAYHIVTLPAEEQARVLARPQCRNLGDADKTLVAGQLVRVEWLGEVAVDADDVMVKQPRRAEKDDAKVNQAGEWLLAFLKAGPKPSDEVLAAGKKAGFSRDRLFTARKAMEDLVRARKNGFTGGWQWELVPIPNSSNSCDASFSSDSSDSSLATKSPEESEESEASKEFEASETGQSFVNPASVEDTLKLFPCDQDGKDSKQ